MSKHAVKDTGHKKFSHVSPDSKPSWSGTTGDSPTRRQEGRRGRSVKTEEQEDARLGSPGGYEPPCAAPRFPRGPLEPPRNNHHELFARGCNHNGCPRLPHHAVHCYCHGLYNRGCKTHLGARGNHHGFSRGGCKTHLGVRCNHHGFSRGSSKTHLGVHCNHHGISPRW